jgi:hypothetical protein
MNRTEAKQLIESPILKAFIEGKKIERICGGEWIDRSEEIDADHLAKNPNLYRIKPEPLEAWMNVFTFGKSIHLHLLDAEVWANEERKGKVLRRCVHLREVI